MAQALRGAANPQQRERIAAILTILEEKRAEVLAHDHAGYFRSEFIDTKFPGHKSNPVELTCGKQLIERLRSLTEKAKRRSSDRIAA